MIWQSDYDYADIYGEGEGIVSFYRCPNVECEADAEFSRRDDKEEDLPNEYYE